MIKQLAWNTFKNTGNIDTYLELIEVENIEKNLKVNEQSLKQELSDIKSRLTILESKEV